MKVENEQLGREKERVEEEVRLYGEYGKIHRAEIEQWEGELQRVREESRA